LSEDKDYKKYSYVLLPSFKTEPEKMAMQLMHFRKIETNNLCPVKEMKRKRNQLRLQNELFIQEK